MNLVRVPKEDGAWWMALTCWIAGWLAAWRLAWEPFVVAAAVIGLFSAAQNLRTARRQWGPDRPAALRLLGAAVLALLVPAAALGLFVWRRLDPGWLAGMGALSALYAPFLFSGSERSPWARLLAVVAITAVAPATYASATGRFDAVAAALWSCLGAYYVVGSVYVMARFRKSGAALWAARLASTLAAGAVAFGATHWLMAGGFVCLAARTWLHRPGPARVDPRRVGNLELGFGTVAAAFLLAGIRMGA